MGPDFKPAKIAPVASYAIAVRQLPAAPQNLLALVGKELPAIAEGCQGTDNTIPFTSASPCCKVSKVYIV